MRFEPVATLVKNIPINDSSDRVAKGSRRLLFFIIRQKKVSLPALTATMNSHANEEDTHTHKKRKSEHTAISLC